MGPCSESEAGALTTWRRGDSALVGHEREAGIPGRICSVLVLTVPVDASSTSLHRSRLRDGDEAKGYKAPRNTSSSSSTSVLADVFEGESLPPSVKEDGGAGMACSFCALLSC